MKSVLLSILIVLPIFLYSQNDTYIGLEFGPKFDIYQNVDNGEYLHTPPFFSTPIVGLVLGQEINDYLSLETGVFINDYFESFRIRGDFGYSSSNAIVAIQIPVRIRGKLPIVKDKFDVSAHLGYSLALNTSYGSTGGSGSFSTIPNSVSLDSIRTQAVSNYSLRKTYHLVDMGLSLDYTFKSKITLSLMGNYLRGFNRVVEMDVKYWINDQPEQTALVYSNGDYYSIMLGIKYPISNLWKKKQKE